MKQKLDSQASAIHVAATTPNPSRLLTRSEVADVFGVSNRWLELAACRGEGPPMVRISAKMVPYRFTDVEEWIASRVDHGRRGEGSK